MNDTLETALSLFPAILLVLAIIWIAICTR